MQIHLRFDNPNGTQKDWIAEDRPDGLHIWWGRTGSTLQSRVVPAHKCHLTPRDELLKRAASKQAKGYYVVSRIHEPGEETPPPEPPENNTVSEALSRWINGGVSASWF
ncbi:putative DNA-binding WGR domain protein [Geothermobacter ehrlichii]|uniref:Putative DNA-binding WGR domain protein n=1 Tax=Geothermobacter ehrlichii TaxID=213224 RepID=A0A5D3WFS1_9BACT|nr:hypothetical protein [Geothermobacter ehrlichii]TYO96750.1 putative DNA-binding WGR domain protein [Geothermobacter ehrlichii]